MKKGLLMLVAAVAAAMVPRPTRKAESVGCADQNRFGGAS
jgi:hypothetical protein